MEKYLFTRNMITNKLMPTIKINGDTFRVVKSWDGWEIIKVLPYTNTKAYILNDGFLFWNSADKFDSMIKAVRFMLENAENLI